MKNYQPALVLRLCDVYVEETDKKKKNMPQIFVCLLHE